MKMQYKLNVLCAPGSYILPQLEVSFSSKKNIVFGEGRNENQEFGAWCLGAEVAEEEMKAPVLPDFLGHSV